MKNESKDKNTFTRRDKRQKEVVVRLVDHRQKC